PYQLLIFGPFALGFRAGIRACLSPPALPLSVLSVFSCKIRVGRPKTSAAPLKGNEPTVTAFETRPSKKRSGRSPKSSRSRCPQTRVLRNKTRHHRTEAEEPAQLITDSCPNLPSALK